jgi:hypothetical protein
MPASRSRTHWRGILSSNKQVAALYSEYREGLEERDRRQRLILAWMQDKLNGKLRGKSPADNAYPHPPRL